MTLFPNRPRFMVQNGRLVGSYAGQAPPTSAPMYATYGGANIVPYAGQQQPGAEEAQQRTVFGQLLARAKAKPNNEALLRDAAAAAGGFAGQGEAGYGNMTGELAQDRAFLRDLASGKNSLAAEQLRQGSEQQIAAQRAMAASASPQNAAMAARMAMNNAARAQYGMSGQAALAGIAERNAAIQALNNMNLQQREQDINVGLGSRQNQLTGLTPKPKGPSTTDKLIAGAAAVAPLFSDERLKKDVRDGDAKANSVMAKLAAKTYAYKNEKHGKGEQLGFLAQDLERAGVKDAVIDTREGKAINVGKLAGANTGMIAALAKRVAKLEGKGK